eukprot:TRINITY_DN79202_c0_g1_i1.p1 TRINITY_DN79202_c0_g1~~TRINITY_DN79202_c0_g1_i1.p1  ORF type:complete len:169 (-),score=71.18 TRINITY_DN79202_c0_g1_i1:39-545(-)
MRIVIALVLFSVLLPFSSGNFSRLRNLLEYGVSPGVVDPELAEETSVEQFLDFTDVFEIQSALPIGDVFDNDDDDYQVTSPTAPSAFEEVVYQIEEVVYQIATTADVFEVNYQNTATTDVFELNYQNTATPDVFEDVTFQVETEDVLVDQVQDSEMLVSNEVQEVDSN